MDCLWQASRVWYLRNNANSWVTSQHLPNPEPLGAGVQDSAFLTPAGHTLNFGALCPKSWVTNHPHPHMIGWIQAVPFSLASDLCWPALGGLSPRHQSQSQFRFVHPLFPSGGWWPASRCTSFWKSCVLENHFLQAIFRHKFCVGVRLPDVLLFLTRC